jgi:hypothetical protein
MVTRATSNDTALERLLREATGLDRDVGGFWKEDNGDVYLSFLFNDNLYRYAINMTDGSVHDWTGNLRSGCWQLCADPPFDVQQMAEKIRTAFLLLA